MKLLHFEDSFDNLVPEITSQYHSQSAQSDNAIDRDAVEVIACRFQTIQSQAVRGRLGCSLISH